MIEYLGAQDVERAAGSVVAALGLGYIDLSRIRFVRSRGSKSRFTTARIHGLSRLWRSIVGTQVTYVIEVLSEHYDHLSQEEREKTIIHELLHVPKAFGGGLLPHRGYVTRRQVDKLHGAYRRATAETLIPGWQEGQSAAVPRGE